MQFTLAVISITGLPEYSSSRDVFIYRYYLKQTSNRTNSSITLELQIDIWWLHNSVIIFLLKSRLEHFLKNLLTRSNLICRYSHATIKLMSMDKSKINYIDLHTLSKVYFSRHVPPTRSKQSTEKDQ